MTDKERKGKVFVFSAPSGTGKTSLAHKLVENVIGLQFSVSHTTRDPRPGEVHSEDYFFVDTDLFKKMIEEDEFLEWAQVFKDFYGTSRDSVLEVLDTGADIILDIDEQGALQIKDVLGESAVLIMIIPPSIEDLEKRLTGRDKEGRDKTLPRIKSADSVLRKYRAYDYIVVNKDFDSALKDLKAIVRAVKLQRTGMKSDVQKLIKEFEKWFALEDEKNG